MVDVNFQKLHYHPLDFNIDECNEDVEENDAYQFCDCNLLNMLFSSQAKCYFSYRSSAKYVAM